MAEEHLIIYLDGRQVGTLTQNAQGRLAFDYLDEYRAESTGAPLSLSMPKAIKSHRHKAVSAFTVGLLPDSEAALQRLGRKYGVSANNPFALLRQIGRDAAGAVQVLPEDHACPDAATRQGDVEWLDATAMEQTLTELARSPETWDAGRNAGRWSLAGAQSKIALFRSDEGRWGIPLDSTPTTHILKPSMPNYQGHHLNEHLCLRAAQLCGLAAANTELLAGDNYEVLISQRYDRVQQNGRWRRLHQEDLCQALAVQPSKKYQSDGGPGVSEIGKLLTTNSPRSSRPDNTRRMFDALVYNVAIAATDAHAKNFSVLLGARDIRLAPLYDMASILPYDREPGPQSAMKIGRTWDLGQVTDKDWAIVGARLAIPEDESVARARDLRARVPEVFAQAAEEPAVPARLRPRAQWIAELIAANIDGRRDRWGRLDVPAWQEP
ncbi:serine/threonine-protein kinase HipA [Kribbella amoyensis]|uniref:Serine/threonine-protein kinase HipA n=1 Tax=Kribbella amoyensis TaxID=996641 RepID=A0A561BRV2_9ACTN|nr:type II toxin-antitoxin system HipA family toxin [Kribbella amoyensis]TWD81615.1 serine/threonine-protein kinase HipA [Kribbella amoyensis]